MADEFTLWKAEEKTSRRIVRRNKDSDGESTTLCSHDLFVPVNTAGGISFYCLSHSNRDA